ncbi:lysozyme inhibitor LprI family protein [Roseovarius sp. M141]|uniref:lysozyme inhibitor LprI family protein n=1 Tax=Roseovarius sp. M141 TaxID=2583806 RepID=UPI0020CD6046|nr:hypothetical protein [Roseovarius sp. M141]MCQ0092132.1 hypothetical protein [Roseovarius sp. M141]
MRTGIVSVFAICVSAALTGSAQAQVSINGGPSYSCDGRLNASEKRICDDPVLSTLDRKMVGHFRRALAGLTARGQARLKEQQLVWLRWRNACDQQSPCLRRRYEQRIADLTGDSGASGGDAASGPAGSGVIVERRITDNKYETVYGDGRIEWYSVDGGSLGTVFPDGTSTVSAFAHSPGPGFPSLPAANQQWADTVEISLLSMIDSWLSAEDQAEYRGIVQSKPITDRVLGHISVIGHLAGR